MTYRYTFLKYQGPRSRLTCPSCGRSNVFVPYIDTHNEGEVVGPEFGKCNRAIKCQYHKRPGRKEGDSSVSKVSILIDKIQTPSYVSTSEFVANSSYLYTDNLSKYLIDNFGTIAYRVLAMYRVSTFGVWNDDTVFWQIDKNFNVRTGKIMLYDSLGKRVKDGTNKINWAHSYFNRVSMQCLYGEHLINSSLDGFIHVVESEKTALICKMMYPSMTWVATGGLDNLRAAIFEGFKDNHFVLYPDKGEAGQRWKEKVQKMDIEINYTIDPFLEDVGMSEGVDLADFLINKMR